MRYSVHVLFDREGYIMHKVYVLFVNHASPYDEHPDWQLHSAHTSRKGALEKASSRLSSTPSSPSEDMSYKIVAMQLEG